MLGFALAQLLFGPLSDRYGRKPVLIVGIGLFALAGAGCASAPSISTLIVLRLVQGAGAGAGMVMTLAIVRDLFDGSIALTQLSYVNLVMSVAPMIAPTIGSTILAIRLKPLPSASQVGGQSMECWQWEGFCCCCLLLWD